MNKTPKLTNKQKAFCREYLVDLNATQAAIRAGYSAKSAYSIGNENLSKPELSSLIAELMAEKAEKADITADQVIAGIKQTIKDAYEAKEFSNALRGYELLGKYLKLFTDRVEYSGHMIYEGMDDADLERELTMLAQAEQQAISTH